MAADTSGNLKDWSTTASSNLPNDSTTLGANLADNLQEIQKVVRQDLAHKGADIVSAASIDLGAVPGLFHDITGSTGPITSFGTVSTGIWKILKFESTPTLTHNATSLILPGAADITAAAGDMLMATSEGSGNWRVNWYVKAAQRPSIHSAIASGRNITARTNAAAPTTSIDIDADELVLKDSSGNYFTATSVNLTAVITDSGANGLDTGSEAGNTWYYGWVIAQPGGTVAGLISASASAPTLPAGYTFKALVTAVRNNGSSNFVPYRQFGNKLFYDAQQAALAGGTATTETSVALSTFAPPGAQTISLFADGKLQAPAGGDVSDVISLRTISASDFITWVIYANISETKYNSFAVEIQNISQNVYYLHTTSGAAPTSITLHIYVTGFKLPGGGE